MNKEEPQGKADKGQWNPGKRALNREEGPEREGDRLESQQDRRWGTGEGKQKLCGRDESHGEEKSRGQDRKGKSPEGQR